MRRRKPIGDPGEAFREGLKATRPTRLPKRPRPPHWRHIAEWLAPEVIVPPDFANFPMQTFRIMVSADLDNLGGHPHHPCHHTPTRLPRRREHADP